MKKLRLTTLALLALAGCTVESSVTFEPIGGDVNVAASWTIDGQVPDAANCAALGAETVQLRIYEAGLFDDYYSDATLEVDCEAGGFVTDPFLQPGSYDLQFVALGPTGGVISDTGFIGVTALSGEEIVAEADFVPAVGSATLNGEWTIDGATPDAASCAAAGIDAVRLPIYTDATGTTLLREYEFDCAIGSFIGSETDPPVTIPRSTPLWYRWQSVDAADTIVGETELIAIEVVPPTTSADLFVADFLGGTTLVVNIFWDTGLDPVEYGTCAEAAVDTMGYGLYDSTDAAYVEDFSDFACANELVFEDPLPDVYSIDIIGDATDGAKWGTTCTGLTVEAGMEVYDCFVDLT